MQTKELEPPPVHRPDPGPGQLEVGVEDAGAMELHQADDTGVCGGVKEVGGEGLWAWQQCSLDRGKEVWEGGEALLPVLEGADEGLGQCRAWAGEEVGEVSHGRGAGGEAAGSRLPRPVAPKPVRPVAATDHPGLDSGGTAVVEEPQVAHRDAGF